MAFLSEREYVKTGRPVMERLLCVLTYFFKSYHHFFKSAFLLACDITIFSKRYHDFFKWNFTIISNRFLKRNQRNKLWISCSQTDETRLNQGKISRLFQQTFARYCMTCDYGRLTFNLMFIETLIFLIILSGKDLTTVARGVQ